MFRWVEISIAWEHTNNICDRGDGMSLGNSDGLGSEFVNGGDWRRCSFGGEENAKSRGRQIWD